MLYAPLIEKHGRSLKRPKKSENNLGENNQIIVLFLKIKHECQLLCKSAILGKTKI